MDPDIPLFAQTPDIQTEAMVQTNRSFSLPPTYGQETSLISYLQKRELGSKHREQNKLLRHRLATGTIIFKKDLLQHYGCVNAVEFSNDGDYLLSGGDDRRVLLWKLDQAISDRGPATTMEAEHRSNIFCLGMDSSKTKIYSGGNDEQVIVHDVATTKPLDFFLHEEPVYGVSVHPHNDSVFLSAGSDGRVLMFDIRQKAGDEPTMLAGYSHAFHAAVFNPMEPRLVATANQKHGLGLWDIRKPRNCVLEYGNWSTATGQRQQQTSMSVRFNQAGTRILGLRRRLPPVLYDIHSPAHLCQFDHPGYYNSCTMKSCSFAGPNDEYILSGSDDFKLYMWKIPEDGSHWVGRSHMTLKGHRSIVNQVRYNYQRCLIASSGVEKLVKLWSVLPLPNESDKERDAASERTVFSHDDYIGLVLRSGAMMTHDYTNQSTDENPRMMAFFDSLVQREIEGWSDSDEDMTDGVPGLRQEGEDNLVLNALSEVVSEGSEEDEGTVAYTRRERSREEGRTVGEDAFYVSSPFMGEESYVVSVDNSDDESGIQNSSEGSVVVTSSPAVSTNANSSSSSSTSYNTSSSASSSVNLLDSGVETNLETGSSEIAVNTSNEGREEVLQNVERIPNRIDQLIAKKRSQLVKLAESKSNKSEHFDEVLINKTIEKARKVIRFSSTESSSSQQSENDSETDTSSLFEENEDSFSPLPSTSRSKTSVAILQSLRRKRMRLMRESEDEGEGESVNAASGSTVTPVSTNGTSSPNRGSLDNGTPLNQGPLNNGTPPLDQGLASFHAEEAGVSGGSGSSSVFSAAGGSGSDTLVSLKMPSCCVPGQGCSQHRNVLEALKENLDGGNEKADVDGEEDKEEMHNSNNEGSSVEEVDKNPSQSSNCDSNVDLKSNDTKFNKPKKKGGRSYRKRLDD